MSNNYSEVRAIAGEQALITIDALDDRALDLIDACAAPVQALIDYWTEQGALDYQITLMLVGALMGMLYYERDNDEDSN